MGRRASSPYGATKRAEPVKPEDMMERTARLGTTNDADNVTVIAVVARGDDQEFRVSHSVPAHVAGIDIPKSVSAAWAQRQGLSSAVASTTTLRSVGGSDLLFVSGGSESLNELDEWRRIGAAVSKSASGNSVALLLALEDVSEPHRVTQAIVEGALLSSYRYRGGDEEAAELVIVPVGPLPTVEFHDALASGVAAGVTVGNAVNWAKRLIDTPAGDLPPKELAKRAVQRLEALEHVSVSSWAESKIEDERLGGLLGVSQGSAQPPRLVLATYDPRPEEDLPHVVLVGKGVTFDSGGLSLKSGEGMMTMKTDMTGAAVVLSVIGAAAELGLSIKVTAIAPMTENLPSHRAVKPGDVLTIRNGMTIEVLNTDAEGRLILADGLSLAAELEPDAIIDVATLTGAQNVALGDEIGGLFASDDALAEQLLLASAASGEALCRLPLFDNYESHIESDVADMKNIGKPGKAGAISAALLLRRFTNSLPWAHFDIAGPGRSDAARGYYTKGATAFTARTILEYLSNVSANA